MPAAASCDDGRHHPSGVSASSPHTTSPPACCFWCAAFCVVPAAAGTAMAATTTAATNVAIPPGRRIAADCRPGEPAATVGRSANRRDSCVRLASGCTSGPEHRTLSRAMIVGGVGMRLKKWGAEFLGTLILVFGGCGSAIIAARALSNSNRSLDIGGEALSFNGVFNFGIGYLGVSLAFGLTVVVGAYAFGHVSGGHFNPAVSIGLATAKRFEWREVPGYVIAQLLGAAAAVASLWAIQAG